MEEQMEFESIVSQVENREAEKRHKLNMAMRWYRYYQKSTKKSKEPLLRQYNQIALMLERQRN